ncbi:hypothetical protein OJAV_G00065780 [Oryzias javanicus]|uniref:Uncharacterized protein n=1 Tax=Oryzias javanicus TaxID=123683 RepID=A0A437D6Z9_ORYJA|nr:hypothetical protein OJAV_G00065780 [Oryzias javanicus]
MAGTCASRSKHQRAQTCVAVGPVMVSADGKLHLCTGASPRAKRSQQVSHAGQAHDDQSSLTHPAFSPR